jgi:hypothetical protein
MNIKRLIEDHQIQKAEYQQDLSYEVKNRRKKMEGQGNVSK